VVTEYFTPVDTRRRAYPRVEMLTRKDFLEEFGRAYSPGQHVTAIGPTQRGKSRLTKEMGKRVASPDLKFMVLAGKPPGRERTWNEEAASELDLRITETWPPSRINFLETMKHGQDRNRNGFLVRPYHTLKDIDVDNLELYNQFKAAILHAYGSTSQCWVTLIDETHHVQVDLGLKKECESGIMRGAPHNAMWHNLQRGRFASQLIYDQPEHILIFKDDDEANQERYAQIGSIDSRYMGHLVRNLKTKLVTKGRFTNMVSQALYFQRSSDSVRIVDT
jgi:hypothetical protein